MKSAPALPIHVLLVDDNLDGLLVRKALLEQEGYQVAVAEDGKAGLEAFDGAAFDVVVTDYRMPRMNGLEFIEALRQRNPNARVILLSGFSEPLGLTEATTGADVVLMKSFNEPVQLTRWVKRLANRAPARKPPAAQRRILTPARASLR